MMRWLTWLLGVPPSIAPPLTPRAVHRVAEERAVDLEARTQRLEAWAALLARQGDRSDADA